MKTFTEKVIAIVKKIPKKKTLTYKEITEKVGLSKASRDVGNIMAKNSNMDVSCYRVIRSDGSMGSYNRLRGVSKKDLLEKEEVKVIHSKYTD